MTALLASVRNLAEAELVVAGGADWLDLKEPAAGALGAVAPSEILRVVRRFRGCLPISATIGDCWDTPVLIAPRVRELVALQVDYVKVGLFANAWCAELAAALEAACAMMPRMIAVCFAEALPAQTDITRLAELGFCGVMLDTANKTSGSLLTEITHSAIAEFLAAAKSHQLLTGLAGSLTAADIPALLPHAPDYLGFRGALCRRGDRVEALEASAVTDIRKLIPPAPRRAAI